MITSIEDPRPEARRRAEGLLRGQNRSKVARVCAPAPDPLRYFWLLDWPSDNGRSNRGCVSKRSPNETVWRK